jgi:hypothetical protein
VLLELVGYFHGFRGAGHTCQRRSKTAAVGRSKNTSVRDARRPPAGGLLVSPRSGSGGLVGLIISADAALAVFEPVTVAVHLEDVNVVGEAIEPRAGEEARRISTRGCARGQIRSKSTEGAVCEQSAAKAEALASAVVGTRSAISAIDCARPDRSRSSSQSDSPSPRGFVCSAARRVAMFEVTSGLM